jgi:hypothetical protein
VAAKTGLKPLGSAVMAMMRVVFSAAAPPKLTNIPNKRAINIKVTLFSLNFLTLIYLL